MSDRIPESAIPIDGVINLNKPTGITSAKSVYRVRAITGVKKSGHAGTLDPGADGVLLICQGRGTKLVESMMDLPKVYRTTARLDVTSESYDSDFPLRDVPVDRVPDEDEVRAVLQSFCGSVMQKPPRVSAIKLGGVPAYKTRLDKNPPKIAPREVQIYRIELLRFHWPEIEFEVSCGRGTYIRSIVRDLGLKLRTGGCLTSLCRTAIGPFSIDDAWTFESIEQAPTVSQCLIPIDVVRDMVEQCRPPCIDTPSRE
jgi:tRNA pseudouridine55 synthase